MTGLTSIKTYGYDVLMESGKFALKYCAGSETDDTTGVIHPSGPVYDFFNGFARFGKVIKD